MFQRYLLFKKDHSELLFYILRQLAKDQLTFIRGTNVADSLTIEIDEKDLLDKVCIFTNESKIQSCLPTVNLLGQTNRHTRCKAVLSKQYI